MFILRVARPEFSMGVEEAVEITPFADSGRAIRALTRRCGTRRLFNWPPLPILTDSAEVGGEKYKQGETDRV
jgi:hypothetical protein